MRFAYADPPYYGMARQFYGREHPDAAVYDTLDGHRALIARLCEEFPDGWALSMASTNLRDILPLCPADCRVGAWVKPFCSFKPGVNPGYCWEPVVWRGGRPRVRRERTVRDYVAVNITLRRGYPGAKPEAFCWWVFSLLNATPEDELVDLFPGSGAVSRAWEAWVRYQRGLFGGEVVA
jgi:site-specific DNA-adenine methylase